MKIVTSVHRVVVTDAKRSRAGGTGSGWRRFTRACASPSIHRDTRARQTLALRRLRQDMQFPWH